MARRAGTWPDSKDMAFKTRVVHAGVDPDVQTGAILTPIHQSTTFVQDSVETYMEKGFSYSRTANPTVAALETKVADLEGAAGACCFSSGQAATITVMSAFLKAGDHCILTECCYGDTNRAARLMFSDLGIAFSFVDFRDPEVVRAAIRPTTRLIFTETPANPTLRLTDVRAVSAVARAADLLHVCDSTFATPLMMRPIELGADMTLQSLTKFYDGHDVTVGGAIASASKAINERLHFYRNIHGNIISPQAAFYILQNSKTMSLRFQRQGYNAQAVADMLEAHEKVILVQYPGLDSFPQKALADAQHMENVYGSMLCFELKGGTEAGRKLMNTVQRPWCLCANLGATESILSCPAVMSHANMLKEDRSKLGISDGFVRVSCGTEDAADLVAALKKAIDDL